MKRILGSFMYGLREWLLAPVRSAPESHAATARTVEQLALLALYRQHYEQGLAPFRLQDVGFSVHSQHEEDGILWYIFALIGTTNKRCVELCAGSGLECNTANLIVNHKWVGLLVDGDERNVAIGRDFYQRHHNTRVWPPKFVNEWVTRGNVNQVITCNGFAGDIDLLSIDVDGVDYWLWEAIECISPRVVVTEVNHLWGPDRAVTVPYRDDFVGGFTEHGSDYAGASLGAFIKLGKKKGYHLIGANAYATNAFFLRNDVRCHWLPEVDPAKCFDHPRAQFGIQVRHAGIKDREWQDV